MNSQSFSLLIFFFFSFVISTKAKVPRNKTFKFVNEGSFGNEGDFIFLAEAEYGATYRPIHTEVYEFYEVPFRLCFYNTTPNAYVFAIRAGIPDDAEPMRWVWDANRNRPVKENATLSFGRDGNLVLADVDGTTVWHTNTANRGVVGIKLLPNGNLVLYDNKGRFIWQNFDYPVDTLLVGMSIRRDINKLVSRTSDINGTDGKYSLVLEDGGLNLYMDNSGHPLKYNGWPGNWGRTVKFTIEHVDSTVDRLVLYIYLSTLSGSDPFPKIPDGIQVLTKINYNATFTFFRLESNGNIKAYTYYDKTRFSRWSESFSFFSSHYEEVCRLPSKCGGYGLCQTGMCIACPSPKGLLGWTENCAPPKLEPCGATKEKAKAKANYYKLVGVQHFLNGPNIQGGIGYFGEGPMKVESCREKCTKDCQCEGFVYKEDLSMCLVLPVLGTLYKGDSNSTAYIKYSN